VDFLALVGIVIAIWFMDGMKLPGDNKRRVRRREEHEAFDAYIEEVMEADEELRHWICHGRGKPYRYLNDDHMLREFIRTRPEGDTLHDAAVVLL